MPTTPSAVPTAYTQTPDELVHALVRAGWTQEQIALAAEISQPTVCRIYNRSNRDPRYSVVEKLRRLVLSLDEFEVAR